MQFTIMRVSCVMALLLIVVECRGVDDFGGTMCDKLFYV